MRQRFYGLSIKLIFIIIVNLQTLSHLHFQTFKAPYGLLRKSSGGFCHISSFQRNYHQTGPALGIGELGGCGGRQMRWGREKRWGRPLVAALIN
jgi:hypothetical protein